MSTPLRRSARLASTAPVTAAPKYKTTVNNTISPQETYKRLVATDPRWAAYDAKLEADKALREKFKASPHEVPTIQEVIERVADLKTRIAAASTAAAFKECAATADAIDEKADRIGWADENATMFLADTRMWCNDAADWLDWMDTCPSEAAALSTAIAREAAGDYSSVFSDDLIPKHLTTSSLQDAHANALNALASFEKSMF
jgi:hypothetical protein